MKKILLFAVAFLFFAWNWRAATGIPFTGVSRSPSREVWPITISNGKVKSVTVTVADFVEFTPYEFVKTN